MYLLKYLAVAGALLATHLSAQVAEPLHLVPLPAKVVQGSGQFVFGKTVKASADAYEGDSIAWVLSRFGKNFQQTTGIPLKFVKKARHSN